MVNTSSHKKSPSQHSAACLVVQNDPPIKRSTSAESLQLKNSPEQRATRTPVLPHRSSNKKSRPAAEFTDNQQSLMKKLVMVATPSGFKEGKVKYIGTIESAGGNWFGVALKKPEGEL